MPIVLFEIKIIIAGYLSFFAYHKDIVNSDYSIIT